MKALLQKDLYALWRHMKLLVLIVVVLSLNPNNFSATFAVIYAAMIPYTAMALDAQSKWTQLAAMLPYSDRDIVLSKYVLGWLCCGAAAAGSLVIQAALGQFSDNAAVVPGRALAAFCTAACILAVNLPIVFRYGVEKGRMISFLFIFLVCGGAGALSSLWGAMSSGLQLMVLLIIAAAVMTAVSIPLAVKGYQKKGH